MLPQKNSQGVGEIREADRRQVEEKGDSDNVTGDGQGGQRVEQKVAREKGKQCHDAVLFAGVQPVEVIESGGHRADGRDIGDI